MKIKQIRNRDTPWYCLGQSARPSDQGLGRADVIKASGQSHRTERPET